MEDKNSLFTEITSEESASINGGWFWVAVTGMATVYGVLRDAQKQKVNRAFSKLGQALFQPVKVY
ncbi:hypothetical protein [Nostoc sp. 'Peltigera membranacea cyanobiont' 232]|uniref:hypothetical protein n=1 Tax=Nostoc sp. 'Peltigera membranacea cyanobiont' 232 TaxID=2014531 RepID=UPI000B956213|nr:hypothetical protein [Nostoc sp. 'Peltigera membranacea cyanobiont' 232]OYE04378.1 hypothetical protein CDG79_13555 [Nostoc sp. 'Peltigera membranacea cyanobiont' 232]